jgi:hypothetical protein
LTAYRGKSITQEARGEIEMLSVVLHVGEPGDRIPIGPREGEVYPAVASHGCSLVMFTYSTGLRGRYAFQWLPELTAKGPTILNAYDEALIPQDISGVVTALKGVSRNYSFMQKLELMILQWLAIEQAQLDEGERKQYLQRSDHALLKGGLRFRFTVDDTGQLVQGTGYELRTNAWRTKYCPIPNNGENGWVEAVIRQWLQNMI